MVKRGEKPVTTGDLEKYLADYSDFSFEIRVLRELRSLGFFCMHGGTYEDPITGKVRQFDIHATGGIGHGERVVDLELAVECKNVGEKFPLLIHAVPRSPAESFIEAVRSFYPPTTVGLIPPLSYCSSSVRLWGERYPSDVPVGKSCEQVGIDSSGKIFSGDNSVFDRISQCLNSAQQLLSKAHYAAGQIDAMRGFVVDKRKPFFNEFIVKCPKNVATINAHLLDHHDIIGGYDLARVHPDRKGSMLLCCTEMNSRKDIDLLCDALKEAGHA